MTTWVIISWVVVALLTAGNVFFFLKLKKAADSMLKSAFPGAKNAADAMAQMQKMMGGINPAQMQQMQKMMQNMQHRRR